MRHFLKKLPLKILILSIVTSTVFMIAMVCAAMIGIYQILFGTNATSKKTKAKSSKTESSASATDVEAEVYGYLSEFGFTDVQAAAIMGNMMQESSMKPYNDVEKSYFTGIGLCGWTTYSPDINDNKLVIYAENHGMDWSDVEAQCMMIRDTLTDKNPLEHWYSETSMAKHYGTNKQEFWEGSLDRAVLSFWCCYEDPEEYGTSSTYAVRYQWADTFLANIESGQFDSYLADADLDEADEEEKTEEAENQNGGSGNLNEENADEEREGGMEIPVYYQANYGATAWGDSNIATSGCGPTSLAMIMSYFTGDTITPPDILAACGGAFYVSGLGAAHEIFPWAANYYGVSYTRVGAGSKAAVDAALESGKPVIAREHPGSVFSKKGHFIVLRGITDDGMYLVNDPAAHHPINTEFSWSQVDNPENFYMIFG